MLIMHISVYSMMQRKEDEWNKTIKKRLYINLDATGSISEIFVIAENDVPAVGVMLHFTGAVVFSLADHIGFRLLVLYLPK